MNQPSWNQPVQLLPIVQAETEVGFICAPLPAGFLEHDYAWELALENVEHFCRENYAFRLEGPPHLKPDYTSPESDMCVLEFPLWRYK